MKNLIRVRDRVEFVPEAFVGKLFALFGVDVTGSFVEIKDDYC